MKDPVKILCVDDERNILRALRRLFIDDDYQLFIADSAEKGLEILDRGENIQVVISDYRMPGMNGVDFLREVCRIWPDTVRIVLSGYADTGSVVDAINDGRIYKFITKPWNDEELRDTIAKAIENFSQQKSKRQLITELKQSNEQLRKINQDMEEAAGKRLPEASHQQTQNLWRGLFGSLPTGVIGIDAAGCLAYFNPAARTLLGEPDEDALNRPWPEVLPETWHPLMEKLIAQGKLSEACRIENRRGWVRGGRTQLEGLSGLMLIFDRAASDPSELPPAGVSVADSSEAGQGQES